MKNRGLSEALAFARQRFDMMRGFERAFPLHALSIDQTPSTLGRSMHYRVRARYIDLAPMYENTYECSFVLRESDLPEASDAGAAAMLYDRIRGIALYAAEPIQALWEAYVAAPDVGWD